MIHTPKLMEEIVVQVPQEIAETYRKTTEKSLADFYGVCVDAPIVDDDMEGVFD